MVEYRLMKLSGAQSCISRFLFVSLQRAWAALRPEGHMVIHITDVFKTKVCEKMCLLLQVRSCLKTWIACHIAHRVLTSRKLEHATVAADACLGLCLCSGSCQTLSTSESFARLAARRRAARYGCFVKQPRRWQMLTPELRGRKQSWNGQHHPLSKRLVGCSTEQS